jgi:WD40 repeat protein
MTTMIPPSAEPSMEERLQFGTFYSAGYDGIIRVWGLPDLSFPPYGQYGNTRCTCLILNKDHRRFSVAQFIGHQDAVWDLKLHSMRPLLASASSDGTVRLWSTNTLTEGAGIDGMDLLKINTCLYSHTFKSHDASLGAC